MSEGTTQVAEDKIASAEFLEMERELTSETSVIALMKEQMTSMLGMVAMFVITIALSLFIRPWYDVAELHAFGESGATQVRFVLLQLVMIFIFTAFVIMLARYKKEWLIKYGIMGVLTIALMYTTVPLMHMLVIDFDVEEFEYQDSFSYEGDYITDMGMDGFITHELALNDTNWSDSISFWNGDGLISQTPNWTHVSNRAPADDNAKLKVVKTESTLTFSNTQWTWLIDSETGEELERYRCSDDVESETYPVIPDDCNVALILDDGIYTFSFGGDMKYYPKVGNELTMQAEWGLPPYLDLREELVEIILFDDRLAMTTERASIVVILEETRQNLQIEPANLEFEYISSSTITSVDFGHSPWSEDNISENDGMNGFLIIGETNGNVTGWEWNGGNSDTEQFELQEKMNLDGLADNVTQVQITDLDESGYTDLLISSPDEAYWLHTKLLKNRITFDLESGYELGVFVQNDSTYYLYSVSSDSVDSGIIEDDMFSLDGLQLYDTPFLIGVLLGLLLMVLLYFHSEWYVVNTVGILVGAGVIVMLGVAFVPGLIIIFMILAAIYDAWAVYRSKHMLELADTMIGLQLPILLVAPQDKGYSFKDENTKMSDKRDVVEINSPQQISKQVKPKKNKEALFMGLGDIIFPGMLVLSAVQWLDSDYSLPVAMFALVGSLLGYLALMTYVARGKAQAGLPLLNGGAILGYLVGGLLFAGTEIFNLGISL